jgi:hypothetical protein
MTQINFIKKKVQNHCTLMYCMCSNYILTRRTYVNTRYDICLLGANTVCTYTVHADKPIWWMFVIPYRINILYSAYIGAYNIFDMFYKYIYICCRCKKGPTENIYLILRLFISIYNTNILVR